MPIMPQTLARLALTLFTAAALAACGSSSSPSDGGAPPVDGGAARDGGASQDGGAADAGCTMPACSVQVGGTYHTCANCPNPIGTVGPFTTTLTHTCGCELQGCITDSDGGQQCGTGSIDPSATPPKLTANLNINYMNIPLTVTCVGPYVDGGSDFSCSVTGVGMCPGTLRPGVSNTCP
jgi:hypothetical protein